MLEIKPCPACDRNSVEVVSDGMFAVVCTGCDLSWPGFHTADGAISDWNALPRRDDAAKLVEALKECQRLFQSIKDYGAMASPSDFVKVQYTWALVNEALQQFKGE